jgi:hypothetical protein
VTISEAIDGTRRPFPRIPPGGTTASKFIPLQAEEPTRRPSRKGTKHRFRRIPSPSPIFFKFSSFSGSARIADNSRIALAEFVMIHYRPPLSTPHSRFSRT